MFHILTRLDQIEEQFRNANYRGAGRRLITVNLVDPHDVTNTLNIAHDLRVIMDNKQVSLKKVIVDFFTMSSILEIGTKSKEYTIPSGSKYYLIVRPNGVYQEGQGVRRVQITVENQVESDVGHRGDFITTESVPMKPKSFQ